MTLDPRKLRAAALLGAGMQIKDVAEEVGVVSKTVGLWAREPEVKEAIRRHREALLPDGVPDAEQVLVQALGATRPDGTPSWGDRIAAAKALLAAPAASREAQADAERVTRIYLPAPDEEDSGAPRPFPIDGARDPRFADAEDAEEVPAPDA